MRFQMKKFIQIWLNRGKSSCLKRAFDQRGTFVLTTGLAVIGLFAFTALGLEVGQWYVVQAELSKAVDAASLIGAKNISNPYLNTEDLMADVGSANFSPGLFGTEGAPQITGTVGQEGKVYVTASTNFLNQISRVLEIQDDVATGTFEKITIVSSGAAQQRDVEIMLVLDKSGSMGWNGGQPIADLKVAAKSFLDFFELTQDNDKFGLITFASGVEVNVPLGHNFVDPMKDNIDDMYASGGTNAEDAIDQADGPYGFSDQTGVPGDEKIQQFLIFFSDGNPTAFRGAFTRDGTDYDAVGYAATWDIKLMNPDVQFQYFNVRQYKTGDGEVTGATSCQSGSPASGYDHTKWWVLEDDQYGVSNETYEEILNTTDPEKCNISWSDMANYVSAVTKQMAIDHAQEVKDKGIKIYTIGLGSVDQQFLASIASGPGFEFYTPDSSDLQYLFQKIATNVKLRLIQ